MSKRLIEELSFKVKKHGYEETDKKEPRYRVFLKNETDGHTLVLFGPTKDIYEGFALGDVINLKIVRAQQTL